MYNTDGLVKEIQLMTSASIRITSKYNRIWNSGICVIWCLSPSLNNASLHQLRIHYASAQVIPGLLHAPFALEMLYQWGIPHAQGNSAGKSFPAPLHWFNLFWDTSSHDFSSLPWQSTPVLNQFVKLNTFISSLFRHMHFALYLKKWWQKAEGALALANIQVSVKSSAVGAAALVLSWISQPHVERCMQSFSIQTKTDLSPQHRSDCHFL